MWIGHSYMMDCVTMRASNIFYSLGTEEIVVSIMFNCLCEYQSNESLFNLSGGRTHLSLCVGDQLSSGSLQVWQGVAKHLRTGDGPHGSRCCYRCLAGKRIELMEKEKTLIKMTFIFFCDAGVFLQNKTKGMGGSWWCSMVLFFVCEARIG